MKMKLRLSVLTLSLCLCLLSLLVARTEAQLNFSTGWGKRSSLLQAPQLVYQDAEAQAFRPFRLQPTDLELFLRYYRKLKQIEAQRLAAPLI